MKKNQHKKNQQKAQKKKARKEKLRLQKHNELQQKFKLVRVKLSEEQIDDIIDQSLVDFKEGRREQALTSLIDIYEDNSEDASLNYVMGTFYLQLGEFFEARIHLEIAIDRDEDMIEAYHNLAYVYEEIGQFDEALSVHLEIIESFPKEHAIVVQSLEYLNNFEEHNGISPDNFIHAAVTFHEAMDWMEDGEYKRAKELFIESVKINPESPPAHGNLAICLARDGEIKKAVSHLDQALKMDPDYELAKKNKRIISALKEGEELGGNVNVTNTVLETLAKNQNPLT
ncbi:tetratricopeptide repeat protein [Lentisphaera marina]|uniref:tetratricopeptide repeat protein n=1 Tax=Lentisphaera marina TaxID=1111041 RepID=UPI00236592CB|nr:tetratricopeptide repeat protein [Lentisphaera marina]MDD7987121.1 tetratricopeptide repeat protein [Lentisphaera marina]